MLPRAPLFVWSEANRIATAEKFPQHRVEAIGAPFLYLHKMLEPVLDVLPSRDLLVYPCHSLRTFKLDSEVHLSLIDQVGRFSPTDVTVCLHPNEFGDEDVRSLYRTLSNSEITTNWLHPPLRIRHDPTILMRQTVQILNHRRVVSNCLTTALFYAAFLRRETHLLHHPSRREPPTEGRGRELHARLERSEGGIQPEVAEEELGLRNVRDPEDLRRTLGLSSPLRGFTASVVRLASDVVSRTRMRA
jgi:hypothetical protein